ncbi:MAG: hypothetical protein ABFD54_06735 [Armatimonadota bacterium]|nr:hypothetical protein [bacterium]
MEKQQDDDEIDRLMEWAEEEDAGEAHITHKETDEPCKSDIADDRAGLPRGTVGNDEENATDDIDENEVTKS